MTRFSPLTPAKLQPYLTEKQKTSSAKTDVMVDAIFYLGYYQYEMMKHKRSFSPRPLQGYGSL